MNAKEALEKLCKLGTTKDLDVGFNFNGWTRTEIMERYKPIIETALKDYENLKLKHKSMQDAVLDDFKKLKAIEIIKEKKVDVDWLLFSIEEKENPLSYYNYFNANKLSETEFDILKEVLK